MQTYIHKRQAFERTIQLEWQKEKACTLYNAWLLWSANSDADQNNIQ